MPDNLPPNPGLCASCEHSRVIETVRGSRFYLCRLSETDPRFPRYPPLPVLRCDGYEPNAATEIPNDPGSQSQR
jgi:hypothetical protein